MEGRDIRTREELIEEIETLRARIAALEHSETPKRNTGVDERRGSQTSEALLDLYEQEHELIAYEIHDGFAEKATAALLQLEAFRELEKDEPDGAWRVFDEAVELLRQSVEESRRFIEGLRPPILEEGGLIPAVDRLITETRAFGEVEVDFSHDMRFCRLARPLANAVFRMVQECLTNARRHSKSQRIRVRLFEEGGYLRAEVQDWGIGFDPKEVPSGRFGLEGIRERARAFGGQATIHSRRGKGTRVTVKFPLVREAEPQQKARK